MPCAIAHVDLENMTHVVSSASGPGTLRGASLAGDSGMYDTGVMRFECSVTETRRALSPLPCDVDNVDLE